MKNLAIVSMVLFIVACTSTNVKEDGQSTIDPGSSAVVNGLDGVYSGGGGYNPGTASGYNSATNGNFYDDPQYGQNVTGGPKASAKDRIIYFSYDSSNIDQRAEAIVKAHANYLRNKPNVKILLEGHTDSRGSREYNISLGERRTISVLKRFNALGISAKQIRIVSYGEENPAVTGYSEDAYKRNRRAIIQY